MIKHWRLFDDITEEQVKQLQKAGIFVRIEDDVTYLDFPIAGKLPFKRGEDVYISTLNENQETILHILFPETVKLIGYNNDYEHK